ncbi:MAG: LexA family transcriptional regulator, partial [Planctomycetaceae bacterium]|nr:LexA family transcriptional regulator [Planctomycetaceae bacterium]
AIPPKELYDRIFSMFPGLSQKKVAELLQVSEHLPGKWKRNISWPTLDVLDKVAELKGLPRNWWRDLGTVSRNGKGRPESNALHGKVVQAITEWPVRGLAAADDTRGTRVPMTDDLDDPVRPPQGMVLVPVIGDSMSPLFLAGQYAMIDAEREGFENNGGIVVASILEPEPVDERPEDVIGTVVKRCYDMGDRYNFVSINNYPPFTAFKDHCRIWPVIGVWFGGKGEVPKG